jgi:hypothetical protein
VTTCIHHREFFSHYVGVMLLSKWSMSGEQFQDRVSTGELFQCHAEALSLVSTPQGMCTGSEMPHAAQRLLSWGGPIAQYMHCSMGSRGYYLAHSRVST